MINLPSSVCHAFEVYKDYLFILHRRQTIKQFKLFPTLFISIIAAFMISDSYLSAAETFWDDFDGSSLGSPTFGYTDKAIPDEFLTPGINFQTSIPDRPSEWDSDMQPTSEPADDIVCSNDADNIKAMRIPAPASVVLVALGLLSLRYTRRLRY
jgi:hypothetical protein